jgi:unsaturated rhamnogalacturonyl hydrolase
MVMVILVDIIPQINAATMPTPQQVVDKMVLANNYFMAKWPDPTKPIVTDATRPSNIWTRATYYEGELALYRINLDPNLYNYAVTWGNFHSWNMRNGTSTRNGDDQCCGQAYCELYQIDPQANRIANITTCITNMWSNSTRSDWSWVDAIHMSMPVFAKLGAIKNDTNYFNKMYEWYNYTKRTHGAAGLYNIAEHLWWRDGDFDPPYVEPNGQDCYWSRGNGWVFAALTRVLDVLPTNDSHRNEYLQDFMDMAGALKAIQRTDGFWNVSLHDPTHYGGPETSGTAMFTYGIAWGINKGILSASTYQQTAVNGWDAIANQALHSNGFLGYVQGTGKQPSDGQLVTYDSVPNFEDFGLGAFLLAGSEMYKLAGGSPQSTPTPAPTATPTPTSVTTATPTPTPTATSAVTATPTPTSTPTPTGTSNIGLNKTASADSSQSGREPVYGNDGSTTTRWCAANSSTGHWWKVDLGSSRNITSTEVMWEKSGVVYKYKVEVSTDNTSWTLKVDKTNNTSTAQTQTDPFTATARYVRITVTGLPASTWASFFEFKVFGN